MIKLSQSGLAAIARKAGHACSAYDPALRRGGIHHKQPIRPTIGKQNFPRRVEIDAIWLAVTTRVGAENRVARIRKGRDIAATVYFPDGLIECIGKIQALVGPN